MTNETEQEYSIVLDGAPLSMADWRELMLKQFRAIEEERRNREPLAQELRTAQERDTVTVRVSSDEDMPDALSEVIAWLQRQLESIPPEMRHTAILSLDTQSDYDGPSYATYEITYERPETDEEWAARKVDVERRAELWAKRREAAERAEFDRLSAKFGG
jgi:predicted metal-dependent hydrolase